MLQSIISSLALLALLLPTQAYSHQPRSSVAHKRSFNRLVRDESLVKRVDGAKFTHYVAGMGACGKYNADSEQVVALNTPMWDGGSHCFEKVTVTVDGDSFEATIVDRCVGCEATQLDFSTGFFSTVSHGNVGRDVMTGSWSFGSSQAKEEEERKKKEAEEAEKKKQQEEEEAQKKAAEEEAAQKKKEEDEAAARASSSKAAAAAAATTSTSSSSRTDASATTSAAASAAPSSTGDATIPSDIFHQLDLIMVEVGGIALSAFHAK